MKIWAKASNNIPYTCWLPLPVHSFDTMSVSDHLWKEWVPAHTRDVISAGISGEHIEAVALLKFLCAAHDIGKAIPAFQLRQILGNPSMHELFKCNLSSINLTEVGPISDINAINHSLASEIILERNGVPRCIASIVGAHHGSTVNSSDMASYKIDSYKNNTGFKNKDWVSIQDSLLSYAYQISGVDPNILVKVQLSIESQVLLSSLVIMSDWISSNELWFPLINDISVDERDLHSRAEEGWSRAKIPHIWHVSHTDPSDIYKKRFNIERPHSFQKQLLDIVSDISSPGIIIVEAPMGEGKTEAALAASEILSERFGMGGVMFALPTQATADGMFLRMKDWVDSVTEDPSDLNSIFLAHGKSAFNSNYTSLDCVGWDNESITGGKAVIHQWFVGRKKGLLSDFTIGTVDNVLMGGLKLRHLALRHLALSNKVVIIDECHAYDSYMGSYLNKITSWLGVYKVPVIILSATLYPSRREDLIEAYLGKNTTISGVNSWRSSMSYPSITYTDCDIVKQVKCRSSLLPKEVLIKKISTNDLSATIAEISVNGGYIGIICNTVPRAQHIYEMICSIYPTETVYLLHSRYTCLDRTQKENEILTKMSKENRQSPPYRMFVVGTQVIEQSLDLDFDVLITDICPIDLLFQRIGRLHRHENNRPNGLESPICFVIDDMSGGLDKGSEYVYGGYQLYNTRILLKDKLSVPSDIPKMVHAAYSEVPLLNDIEDQTDYNHSYEKMKLSIREKERKASIFQIYDPPKCKTMVDWLKNDASDDDVGNKASATVRDTNGSVEVILLTDNMDGTLSPISGDKTLRIDVRDTIDDKIAFELAGNKIALPARFASDNTIGNTISELKKITFDHIPPSWISTGWLKGELFLITCNDGSFIFGGIKMKYTLEEGLVVLNE